MAGANAETASAGAGPGADAGGADQAATVRMLADPATHGGRPVRQVATHGAIVFLAGDRAWKLKRAVRYPYLDFSTAERRRAACEAEIRLNRRTAPEIYERVVPVTCSRRGRLAIDGEGAPVDWLVAMRRFPDDAVLDRVAEAGGIDLPLIEALADHVAQFHAAAERRPDRGGADAMAAVVDTNARALAACVPPLDAGAIAAVGAGSREMLGVLAPLLERRRRDGFVRLGHGDLHLGNICLVDGRPRLFDALEFDENLVCIDTMYDVAFLVMDLWARGLRCQANRFLERYCERTGDLQGLAPLPLFLSMRAAIRAHVSVAMAATAAPDRRPILARSARLHLDHAQAHLRVTPPRLVAVGGLSGSGKSTIAHAVAPWLGAAPGAAVLRSDVVRKRLAGIDPSERAPPGAYAPGSSARVYAALREQAATALAAGRAVIVDAVHARPEERAAVEAVATRLGVPFAGIWLDAPEATLVARVDARTADASDADGAVVRQQLGYALGEIGWHRIAAAPAPAEVAETVAAVLGLEDVSTFCIGGKGE